MQTSLRGISNKAAQDKKHQFGNLYGLLNVDYLKWCFWQLKRDASAGVDKMSFCDYQENLEENLPPLVIRYADDFVCAFEQKQDAELFYQALSKRMGNFGLEIAPEKTKILPFSRFRLSQSKRFDFLGFEFGGA